MYQSKTSNPLLLCSSRLVAFRAPRRSASTVRSPQADVLLATCIHPQVQDVKAAIERENAEFSAARLALTCSGQVLNGRSTLAECGVKEEDVLVCTEAKV